MNHLAHRVAQQLQTLEDEVQHLATQRRARAARPLAFRQRLARRLLALTRWLEPESSAQALPERQS